MSRASLPCRLSVRPPRRRLPIRRAFTLVELLVALATMALLAALAWRGIDGMLRARAVTQDSMARSLRLNTVLLQWEQDLAALHDSALVPALQFDGRSLRLTRASDEGARIVAWTLRDGAWWRWTGPLVQRVGDLQQSWLASQQLQSGSADELRLLDGVQGWQLYYFRGNAWTNAQSSAGETQTGDGAPGARTGREPLPDGVRLVLQFADGTLTRDLIVPPQAP